MTIADALDFCHSNKIVHRDIKVQVILSSLKIYSGLPRMRRLYLKLQILGSPNYRRNL
jgi:serine/threonine protein kinase